MLSERSTRYLEYTKVLHTEPVKHQFSWGQRAEVEVSKLKILEFLGEVRGSRSGSCFFFLENSCK